MFIRPTVRRRGDGRQQKASRWGNYHPAVIKTSNGADDRAELWTCLRSPCVYCFYFIYLFVPQSFFMNTTHFQTRRRKWVKVFLHAERDKISRRLREKQHAAVWFFHAGSHPGFSNKIMFKLLSHSTSSILSSSSNTSSLSIKKWRKFK